MEKFKIDKEALKSKFNKEKFIDAANTIGDKAKQAADVATKFTKDSGEFLETQYKNAKDEIELKMFSPVFENEIKEKIQSNPIMLRIEEDGGKRNSSEVCVGSIGHIESIKGKDILTIYNQFANDYGFNFYPVLVNTFYLSNPYVENMYICIDDYFNYLKRAKVDELEQIAFALGAKHVKVTLKEVRKQIVSNSIKGSVSGRFGGDSLKGNHAISNNVTDYSELEVAKDVEFEGNDNPIYPELVYFKEEKDILNLIQMRLDKNINQIKSKTYTLNYVSSKDIREETATSIDAVLKHLHLSGNASVASEVEAKNRIVFEYTIKF